ncbi:MAG: hypothetical protein H7270_05615 [Dermatophilaceae bacterium]|nr:hypothetical protein [Dermatophilaceae bacterium]
MTVELSDAVRFPDIPDTPDAPDTPDTPDTSAALRLAGPAAARPAAIRARTLPDISPPTIDSRSAVPWDLSPFIQGTLAISFSGAFNLARGSRIPEDPELCGHRATFASDLPEPEAWVRHMAQALIEVMSGARPAPQVIRWTTPEVYSAVAQRNAAAGRRSIAGRSSIAARRALVRQVMICEPAAGVIEACAVVVDNGRVRALAMRLRDIDRRWVVCELQVG